MDSKILLSLFAVLCLGSVLGNPSGRFVGGDEANVTEYGYMVGITTDENCVKTKSPRCLGTLIGEKHVITAASCVNEFNKELKICIWNAGGEKVEKIYVNEHYRVGNDQNIAVLKLKEATKPEAIKFYGDKEVVADKKCNIIGLAKEAIKGSTTTTTTTTTTTLKPGTEEKADKPTIVPPTTTTTAPTHEFIFKVMKEVTFSKCPAEVTTPNRTCVKKEDLSASPYNIGAPLICDNKYAGILINMVGTTDMDLVYLKTKDLEQWINEKVSSACTSTISLTLIVASIAATLFGRQ